jgi:hypothetical protein
VRPRSRAGRRYDPKSAITPITVASVAARFSAPFGRPRNLIHSSARHPSRHSHCGDRCHPHQRVSVAGSGHIHTRFQVPVGRALSTERSRELGDDAAAPDDAEESRQQDHTWRPGLLKTDIGSHETPNRDVRATTDAGLYWTGISGLANRQSRDSRHRSETAGDPAIRSSPNRSRDARLPDDECNRADGGIDALDIATSWAGAAAGFHLRRGGSPGRPPPS